MADYLVEVGEKEIANDRQIGRLPYTFAGCHVISCFWSSATGIRIPAITVKVMHLARIRSSLTEAANLKPRSLAGS